LFKFPGYNRDAKHNNTKISSHPNLYGHIQEQEQQQMLERMQQNRNPYVLLVRMKTSATIMESNTEISQKSKNRTAI
jgi:hypothetical protein